VVAFLAKPMLRRSIAQFGYGGVILMVTLAGSALMGGFALMDEGTGQALIVVAVLALGAVRTMHFNAVNALTYSEVADARLSGSVASAGVFQQLSMGLGISLGAAVLAFPVPPGGLPGIGDFQHAFLIMGLVPLLSAPVLVALWAGGRRKPVSQAA